MTLVSFGFDLDSFDLVSFTLYTASTGNKDTTTTTTTIGGGGGLLTSPLGEPRATPTRQDADGLVH